MLINLFKQLKERFAKPQLSPQATEALKQRFLIFQKLLSANNSVLELMADMSEKLSAEYLFDKSYIEQNSRKISEGVSNIVANLNKLSSNKYKLLDDKITLISSQIDELLTRKYKISEDVYTLPFEELSKDMVERFGGKNANLGEVRNYINLPTPDGFAISAYAFKRYLEHNAFLDKIDESLKSISIQNFDELTKISRQIQDMVVRGKMPIDLKEAIVNSAEILKQKLGNNDLKVSVRSSAMHEDSEYSFAGQYYTFLNVPADDIAQRYKEVVASLFTPRAIFYFKSKGIEESDMVMSVGVLRMIDAISGGVIYTTDPNKPRNDDIIISSVHGLGKCVVDGTITPEMYRVTRHPDIAIAERNIPLQKKMLFCKLDGEVGEIPLPEAVAGKPSLTDEQIDILSRHSVTIEKHYRCPQDIEWAIDKDGTPFILQTRPLRIIEKESPRTIPTFVKGYNILISKGIIACKGIGFGNVQIVKTDEDLINFPDNAILVVRHTSPKYVTMMNRAAAIVTDFGGATGHMASLAREFQVPTILNTEIATEILENGQEITVDAFNCNIYEGKVEELMEFTGKRADPFKETQIYKLLQRVIKLIIPLNLADPNAPAFKPESCETFHDITRFCHEMAMHELFDVVGTSADDVGAIRLVSNIPMEIWLLDLGEGLSEHKGFVKPENLQSVPFIAFFKGISSMRWPQGQAVDAKGFLDSMIRTVTMSEEELKKVGEKSFLIISKTYMSFAIRLGYHLSSVEAFAGDNTNDNYIKFFFKGGGAVVDRRLRRVRLIKAILKAMDFDVKITGDVVNATLMKYRKDQIEKILEVMGRLTVFTKQLDMVMYNDAITDFYIDDFCRSYIKK